MSDDPILAALTRLDAHMEGLATSQAAMIESINRLEAGQEALANRLDRMQHEQQRQGGVLDRTEGKLDVLAADMLQMKLRVSALESDFAGHYARTATTNNRLDALDVRMGLIERRLELRDQA